MRKTFHRIGFPIGKNTDLYLSIQNDQNQDNPVSRTTFNIEFNQNPQAQSNQNQIESNENQEVESNEIKDRAPFESKSRTGKILWKKIPKSILKKPFQEKKILINTKTVLWFSSEAPKGCRERRFLLYSHFTG
ncbi:hypothetical protein LEP1GSC043_3854 [Leptospira weilii str. Ecochallenge]|uniref:Uncharacterized protein n=1 Tax=Leptospira weilii str. Ecochallenge TaxID=1049986 RepID=N1U8Q0_9LEPT|nr:hypothetical protein LEP1GSC043_3854 [Leptospira weilii str. Ecochallenge]